MRLPFRKPTKFSQISIDPHITENKYRELQNKLLRLKKIQPEAAREVARLAELGDFSENAEYQLAKGRLRGINNQILILENRINHAVIIDTPGKSDIVQMGSTVTIVATDKKIFTYQILGASEVNPKKGIISRESPIGQALIGHKIGEEIKIKLAVGEIKYKIIKIE